MKCRLVVVFLFLLLNDLLFKQSPQLQLWLCYRQIVLISFRVFRLILQHRQHYHCQLSA